MSLDKLYMKRCIDLAILGKPKAFPNPLVGCVIVKNNKIISEGYHKQFGKEHAEIAAISSYFGKSLFYNRRWCILPNKRKQEIT